MSFKRNIVVFVFAMVTAILAVSGCGGSSSGGTGDSISQPRTLKITWPARSRAELPALSSALSVHVVIANADASGEDVILDINRDSSKPAGYTGTYSATAAVKAAGKALSATFHTGRDGTGDSIGVASATVSASGKGLDLANIVLEGKVKSVTVPDTSIVSNEAPRQLTFGALDADGRTLAVSIGSAIWTKISGSSIFLSRSGIGTVRSLGDTVVRATVDGIDSPDATVSVVAPAPPPPVTLQSAATPRNLLMGAAAASYFFNEEEYKNVLRSEYGVLTAENEMKFEPLHPRPDTDPNPYDFTGADALVNFAESHNIKVRGHTLVWHTQVPSWVTGGGYTPTQLSTILHGHIQTVASRYTNRVFAWDVYNEAFNDDGTMRSSIWYDSPGIGFAGQGTKTVEQAFVWARAADPTAKLFYNDYSAETINAKSDAIYAMAQDFKARGIPINGIGFQFHVDLGFDSPATLASVSTNFARFAALGLELHITELDIRVSDSSPATLAAQAQLYGKLVQLCRAQPAVKLIQTWGFTDKHSWIPLFFSGQGWALPFDDNYQKKAAYTAILNALQAP